MSKRYMRATKYEDKRAKFPGWVQPKHNGIRCLWDGQKAVSREGNEFPTHVSIMLTEGYESFLRDGWTLDGELMLPESFKFQDTQSAVTKEGAYSHLLCYRIFDGHDGRVGGPTFAMRREILPLTVETHKVHNTAEVHRWYEKFLADGHEGLMFRTDAPYQFGSGARHLMKLKPHHDEEFLIIDVWEGTGKFVGMPVFRCLKPGIDMPVGVLTCDTKWVKRNTFGVTPEGTFEQKRQLFADRKKLIGKQLTVRYWDKYASGVPQFPIGVCVRDYE